MKKIALLFLFLCALKNAYAWQHEIAVGYGQGKEIEQNYYNRGVVLSGKFYKFPKIDDTLIATIDGTLAYIESSTKDHNRLTTAAIALAMRAYFANPDLHTIRPYIQASFGPVLLSARQLGNREQGANVAFQTSLETGSEFDINNKTWDINLRLLHYCNAGIFHPNQGIDLLPVLSIGYMF
jgi:hypothetical protein